MRVIYCPSCQELLPGTAKFCAKCGEHLAIPAQTLNMVDEDLIATTIMIRPRPAALKVPHYYAMNSSAQHASSREVSTVQGSPRNSLASSSQTLTAIKPQLIDQMVIDDELQLRGNWEKIVTHKTPRVTPEPETPPAVPVVYKAPKGTTPPAFISVRKTRHKKPPRLSTHFISWISILVLLCLLLGGAFGLAVSYGRGLFTQASHSSNVFALKVTPSNAAIGGIITLHGTAFTPNGKVGLTRDANITLIDTSNLNIIHANSQGSFNDTVIVDSSWGAGAHIIHAEDAILHKSASFTVFVTGQGIALRPSHLLFSQNSIDLGSGDQATNTTQIVTLSNTGAGQIDWHATAMQPWLLISPKSGTLSFNQKMNVEVAGDRSNLNVGTYVGGLLFTSNTGQETLPVKMSVTQLQPGHEAVLQLTPPLLSFTGTDGAANPLSQEVTVSNPGVLSLQWAATSVTNDGSSWLSVYPVSGTVAKGSSQLVTINVNTSTMLPGVYYGSLTFSSQGSIAAKDSPQTIFVTLVVLPQCSIQISPGGLNFASASLQPSLSGQGISLSASQGCSASVPWSTTITTSSGGNWLSIGPTGGATPANPVVRVNSTGLKPGVYSGSIIFSWPAGTQTLPVSFTVGQARTPIMASMPATLVLNGIIGQTVPISKTISITNPGGAPMTWHASVVTTGGAWLGISPASGTILPHSTSLITVTGKVLGTLTAGTYSGTITIAGTDNLGHPVFGSPNSIPVNFVVQATCSVVAAPLALNFLGAAGGTNPAAQSLAITTSGACVNTLTWTATTAVVAPTGGTWLTATPTGSVSSTVSSATSVGVLLKGLAAGTYTGSVTITAIDSVTKLAVSAPKAIPVTLTVQSVCTLQAPSSSALAFSAEAGSNPASQTFSIGVLGACTGNVTITPTATMSSGTGWLAVSAPVTVISGGSATFTVTISSAKLAAGTYTGSIALAALNGSIADNGSPQVVGITLKVLSVPALTAGSGSVTFNASTGIISLPITIKNSGSSALNWAASLGAGTPSYVSLSALSGTNLTGGTTTSISVLVNTNGLAGGKTVTTNVAISAIDSFTGQAVAGSPVNVPISITIPSPQATPTPTPPPQATPTPTPTPQATATATPQATPTPSPEPTATPTPQATATPTPSPEPTATPTPQPRPAIINTNALAFTTTVGTNPAAQTVNIKNPGGDTLTWTVSTPSQPWLIVSPTSGSGSAGQATPITFNVDITGLAAGIYNATVVITPSVGTPVTVNVVLTIN